MTGDQSQLGREGGVLARPGIPSAVGIAGPGSRDVRFPVHRGVLAPTRVDEVDGKPGVLGPGRAADVLTPGSWMASLLVQHRRCCTTRDTTGSCAATGSSRVPTSAFGGKVRFARTGPCPSRPSLERLRPTGRVAAPVSRWSGRPAEGLTSAPAVWSEKPYLNRSWKVQIERRPAAAAAPPPTPRPSCRSDTDALAGDCRQRFRTGEPDSRTPEYPRWTARASARKTATPGPLDAR